jgi:SAM-dependent methyltransferase
MTSFWTRADATVMGDMVSRAPALRLVGEIRDLRVAELGCGSGWFTLRLEVAGARVFGCEVDPQSVFESQPGRIAMMNARCMGYRANAFDVVFAVGVLGLERPSIERRILREAARIVRHEGVVIIAVTHPSLYAPGSASRSGTRNWVMHKPVYAMPASFSQPFEERYVRSDGEVLTWTVWSHPAAFYRAAITAAGLVIEAEEEPRVTTKMLETCSHWGTKDGDPAVLLFKARKVRTGHVQ